MTLDVFDLCTEDLQNKLVPVRSKFKEEEDKQAERVLKVKYILLSAAPNSRRDEFSSLT